MRRFNNYFRELYEYTVDVKELEEWSLPPDFEHFDIEIIENFWREAKDRVSSLEDIEKYIVRKTVVLFTFAIPISFINITSDEARAIITKWETAVFLPIPGIAFIVAFVLALKILRQDIFPINGINPAHLQEEMEEQFEVLRELKYKDRRMKTLLTHQLNLYCKKINRHTAELKKLNSSFGWTFILFVFANLLLQFLAYR